MSIIPRTLDANAPSPVPPQPGLSRGQLLRRARSGFLALLVILAIVFGASVARHTRAALAALQDLQKLEKSGPASLPAGQAGLQPRLEAAERARQDFSRARSELAALQSETRPLSWALTRLGWLPRWGQDLAAVPKLLDLGVAGTRAGEHALAGLTPLLEALAQQADIPHLLQAITAGERDFQEARAALADMRALRASLGPSDLLHPALKSLVEGLGGRLDTADGALGLALVLPKLLGTETPQSYLLLGQNSDELRATGGFISTAGTVTLSQGKVQRLDYGDSYALDPQRPRPYLAPPAPYQRYMLLQDWRLRDANWWADFPTSARQAEALLWLDQGERVDGVVAFDQKLLQLILSVLGPVEVPAFQERVDATDVVEVMEAYAHPPGYKEGFFPEDPRKIKVEDRKAFVRELARATVAKIEQLNSDELLRLAAALRSALAEKHLLLYLNDGDAGQFIHEMGWDGSVQPPAHGDFLLVAETNVGYSKANRFVERSLDYDITLSRGLTPVSATATITYQNRNAAAARHCSREEVDFATSSDSCYKSYLRIYTPPGAVPVEATGLDSPLGWFSEGESTVLAGLVVLTPGATKVVRVTYLPPRSIADPSAPNRYQLLLSKQPGVDSMPVTITASYLDPQALSSREASPAPSLQKKLGLTLKTDQQIRLEFP